MSRCRACDAILEESEIIWKPDVKRHEDLCRCCRKIIFDLESNESLDVEGLLSDTETIEYE